MRLDELLIASGIDLPDKVNGAKRVGTVCCDSRQCGPESLFVAISGEDLDGLAFAAAACGRGAVAVVGERLPDDISAACFIPVSDARYALAMLCCAFYGFPSRSVAAAGVTGTNGKSTVAYLLHGLLSRAGLRVGLIGTVEYLCGDRRIPASRTTPDAVSLQGMLAEMKGFGVDAAVMEVSSHALVQSRVAGINFSVAAFTNLSRDHLDYHGNMEAYFLAKRRLFEQLKATGKGTAVVNVADQWGQRLALWCRQEGVKTVTVACERFEVDAQPVDLVATDIRMNADASFFQLQGCGGSVEVCIPLVGRYNVENALVAIGAGGAMGIPLETMVEDIRFATSADGRFERIENDRGIHVFVDYAHTGDALKKVLQALREVAPRRLIVVFGCGGDRDKGKRSQMGRVAGALADRVIVTNDNPRSEDPNQIMAQIVGSIPPGVALQVEPDRRQAIRLAVSLAEAGDSVLIAGKGHERVQVIGGRSVEFDDREEARRALNDDG